jgi:hypothetical protein
MSEQELIELLADKHHDSWARWMHFLFSKCDVYSDGDGYEGGDKQKHYVIPHELAERWQRQIDTPYSELTEQEKESDRAEVAHILPIIKEYGASLPAKDEWKEAIHPHIQKLNEQST